MKYYDDLPTWMLKQGIRDYKCGCKVVEMPEHLINNPTTQVLVETCDTHTASMKAYHKKVEIACAR